MTEGIKYLFIGLYSILIIYLLSKILDRKSLPIFLAIALVMSSGMALGFFKVDETLRQIIKYLVIGIAFFVIYFAVKQLPSQT